MPVINEFLAVNAGGLFDLNGNTSDWIEIYNAGDQSIDLDGWHLTDERDTIDNETGELRRFYGVLRRFQRRAAAIHGKAAPAFPIVANVPTLTRAPAIFTVPNKHVLANSPVVGHTRLWVKTALSLAELYLSARWRFRIGQRIVQEDFTCVT